MIGPWTDIVLNTKDYVVYKDGFPVTEGHILFVPKEQDWEHLSKCYKAAYAWGYDASRPHRLSVRFAPSVLVPFAFLPRL